MGRGATDSVSTDERVLLYHGTISKWQMGMVRDET